MGRGARLESGEGRSQRWIAASKRPVFAELRLPAEVMLRRSFYVAYGQRVGFV